jgi:hypothetical protein
MVIKSFITLCVDTSIQQFPNSRTAESEHKQNHTLHVLQSFNSDRYGPGLYVGGNAFDSVPGNRPYLHTVHRVRCQDSTLQQITKTNFHIKNAVFWDVIPCGSCRNRRFGGTYRFHHQGERNRRARNVRSNLHPQDGGDSFLRNFGSYNSYMASHPRRRHPSQALLDFSQGNPFHLATKICSTPLFNVS